MITHIRHGMSLTMQIAMQYGRMDIMNKAAQILEKAEEEDRFGILQISGLGHVCLNWCDHLKRVGIWR